RRRQPADHQILGRLVEHAAPAGQHHADRIDDRPLDAVAAFGHGDGVHAAVCRALDGADALDALRAAGAGAEAAGLMAGYLAMGVYAAFVWPAYAIALVVLGGITIQSWLRYRASRRALDQLQRRR